VQEPSQTHALHTAALHFRNAGILPALLNFGFVTPPTHG